MGKSNKKNDLQRYLVLYRTSKARLEADNRALSAGTVARVGAAKRSIDARIREIRALGKSGIISKRELTSATKKLEHARKGLASVLSQSAKIAKAFVGSKAQTKSGSKAQTKSGSKQTKKSITKPPKKSSNKQPKKSTPELKEFKVPDALRGNRRKYPILKLTNTERNKIFKAFVYGDEKLSNRLDQLDKQLLKQGQVWGYSVGKNYVSVHTFGSLRYFYEYMQRYIKRGKLTPESFDVFNLLKYGKAVKGKLTYQELGAARNDSASVIVAMAKNKIDKSRTRRNKKDAKMKTITKAAKKQVSTEAKNKKLVSENKAMRAELKALQAQLRKLSKHA